MTGWDTFVFILGVVVGMLLLCFGGYGVMDGYVVEAAVMACKDQGGIHDLYPDATSRHVRCNNGARVLRVERRPG